MTEPNDVGGSLLQSAFERKIFGVPRQRYEAGFTVRVVAHQDREVTAGL